MPRAYNWEFPLPRVHTGMLQGNGMIGTMIWGAGSVLKVTMGRADFWDHRGGMRWTEKQTYADIRRLLEAGDEEGLKEVFASTEGVKGTPRRPSVIPVGRIELDFGEGVELVKGTLNVDDGTVEIAMKRGKRTGRVRLVMDMLAPVVAVQFPEGFEPSDIRRVPAWEAVGEYLESICFKPPEMFETRTVKGWVQTRPNDPPLAVGCRRKDAELAVALDYGTDPASAKRTVSRHLARAVRLGYKGVLAKARKWWNDYWADVPAIELPNSTLRFCYEYGMYKFAGLTHPDGVAATLQGPWIEDYQMPPWSSDYHFNINVQMCYWPAYHGNRLRHLKPLFDLIKSWDDTLRHNARMFLGIQDGRMLPHAVDDRCRCMGGFWTGTIDHGCTAWVAQMMYRYYRYTMDEAFLRETAWPFMVGAMRVYEGMLEKNRDGRYELPVSVSPEYRGSSMDAWGRNASFQLACIHMLCEMLQEAADVLGKTPEPVWRDIAKNLPQACLYDRNGNPEIALWDGVPLEESHRHHSHLAGITPFDTFDWSDESMRQIIENALTRWVGEGPGKWSGWCIPWAAMIHMRVGNPDAAELWLEVWERAFTNEGHGTLHDVAFPGVSLMGATGSTSGAWRPEVMQMDAGMSCTAAIQEMMVLVKRGVNELFAGCPSRWKRVSFDGLRTDGGFLVSAARRSGTVGPVKVQSPYGGPFKLRNPWSGEVKVKRNGKVAETMSGEVLVVETSAGEKLDLKG